MIYTFVFASKRKNEKKIEVYIPRRKNIFGDGYLSDMHMQV